MENMYTWSSAETLTRLADRLRAATFKHTDSVAFFSSAEIPELQVGDAAKAKQFRDDSNCFVVGNPNLTFGTWNRLVAALPNAESIATLNAHGGEFIPGSVDDHVRAIRARAASGLVRPIQLDIDITMACPSACSFCFSANYRATRSTGRHMTKDAIHAVIDDAVQLGVKVVRFDGGGDPTSSPYLAEAIEHCADLGVKTALLTAGDLLTEPLMRALAKARTYVRVSLNAASDATRAQLHGTPRRRGFLLSSILEKLATLDTMRRLDGDGDPRMHMLLGATSMIHPINISETYEIAARAKSAGLDHISFRVVLGSEHAVSFTKAQLDQFAVDRLRIRTDLCGEEFRVFLPTRNLSDSGYVPGDYFSECRASTHRALVEVGPRPDEPVLVPCGRYRGSGFNLDLSGSQSAVYGRLSAERSLKDVWMSEPMVSVLSRFPAACGDCIDRSANVTLARIEDVLRRDPDAEFFQFWDQARYTSEMNIARVQS